MTKVMLYQKDISDETSLEPNIGSGDSSSDLKQLRKLLLGSEYQELLQLQREFSDHSHTSQKISQVISEAIAIRSKQDNSIANVLVPSVEDAIRASAKRNPKRLANALFPVMGPAIRESVAETVSAMMQQVNQLLENSLSARSIKWRIDAFRTNRSFAEVMLSETLVYQVEQVFLIHRESSLLINHLTSANAIVKDPDMVSGMLTAVTDFVKDSFVVDRQQNVKSIKFGQLNLLIEAGPYAIIVAAVRGIIPSDLQITLREQIEELHRLYSSQLEKFDGNAEQFPDTYEQLDKCLLSKKKDGVTKESKNESIPWPAVIALCLLLLAPFVWWLFNKIEQNRWQGIVHQLQAEPGVVVLSYDKKDGEYIVDGLLDPLAKAPNEIIAANTDFDEPVKFQMQSYYSNESEIVNKRLYDVLNLPTTVSAIYDEGLLTLSGEAQTGWITDLPNKLPFIWGVNRVDTSQLREFVNLEQKIVQLIGSIEEVVIEFASNSTELSPDDLKSISKVVADINHLKLYSDKAGRAFKLGILGFSDAAGVISAKNEISEKRARSVFRELVRNGINGDDLIAKGLGNILRQSGIIRPINCYSERCVVFEVYIN